MQTLADFLTWAEEYFSSHDLMFGHGTNNAWDEAVALALHVLKLPPTVNKAMLTRKLTAAEKKRLRALAQQRVQTLMPVPYLTKEAWFCGDKYYVDPRVIIPRSPIAELINNKFKPWLKGKTITTVLDLCTGSGCLAIACAKKFPHILVDAVDIAADALAVAAQNIQQHQLTARVTPIQSDLFAKLKGKSYDLIISNPPYVSAREHYYLPQEYQYEPKLALVSGADGLACTQEILKTADAFLKPEGCLFVEVGNNWRALQQKYPTIPFTWLKFKHGGEGVFLLTKAQLMQIKQELT